MGISYGQSDIGLWRDILSLSLSVVTHSGFDSIQVASVLTSPTSDSVFTKFHGVVVVCGQPLLVDYLLI